MAKWSTRHLLEIHSSLVGRVACCNNGTDSFLALTLVHQNKSSSVSPSELIDQLKDAIECTFVYSSM